MRNRIRVRNGEIYVDGRHYGNELPNLPSIFAREAREELELGARISRHPPLNNRRLLCAVN